MPILTKLDFAPEVLFLAANPDRGDGLETAPIQEATLTLEGISGEAHAGATRAACTRMKGVYPKGVEIRNARQITIVSAEEMAEVGAAMGLGEPVRPEWIGANIMLRGLPRLTEIPPGTRLVFDGGAGLVVDLENAPCRIAAEAIAAHRPGQGLDFPKKARTKRGVTAWVERAGALALGATARVFVPPQRRWPPDDD